MNRIFTSTRDKSIRVSAADAIKQGISKDGGLFVPTEFSVLSADELRALCGMDYRGRAADILSRVLSDFTAEEVKDCVTAAYTKEKFGDHPAPVKKLCDSTYILELWHGPTCAFKDMALQILPHLTAVSLKKTGEEKTVLILVATSGDTGKAALEGFKDVAGTKILVFYPTDGVSNIQKLQMTTQEGGNVGVCGIFGNFDDAQNGVKAIFTDSAIEKTLEEQNVFLSSANSINWGRLAPQIVYYFSAYCDLVRDGEISLGEKINITVPTGNFGNILAAYYAKKMGLPVKTLLCASNQNNVLTEFLEKGIYDRNRQFFTTVSPSMDILISSNLERLLFDLLKGDDKALSALMSSLKNEGKYEVSNELHKTLTDSFAGGCCSNEETKRCISTTFQQYSYVVDTHTAVAVKVYEDYKQKTGDNTKTIIASTASPFKFSEAVLEGLAGNVETSDDFKLLDTLSELGKLPVPAALSELKGKTVRFTDTCPKDKMAEKIFEIL